MKMFFKTKKINPIKQHEQDLINKVIELLETKPEKFSSRWFCSGTIQNSLRSEDNKILILIRNGEIFSPIEPKMTYKQRRRIKTLIKPIVEKDSKDVVNELLNNYN